MYEELTVENCKSDRYIEYILKDPFNKHIGFMEFHQLDRSDKPERLHCTQQELALPFQGRGITRAFHTEVFSTLLAEGVREVSAVIPQCAMYNISTQEFCVLWDPIDDNSQGGARSLWPLTSIRFKNGYTPETHLISIQTRRDENWVYITANISIHLDQNIEFPERDVVMGRLKSAFLGNFARENPNSHQILRFEEPILLNA